ncbi:MAG: DUF460 domain-containing protein [Candidatus Korarchaeota archaeon]|nr:DUF460 domain-containing protein [Candidatus Korarchaeota archaeon]
MRYLRTPVLGVDIKAGSPRGKAAPKYSACLLRDSGEPEFFDGITLAEILRIVRQMSRGYLAVDNIFELAKDSRSLKRLVASIPEDVKIIQVTGPPGEGVPLRKLARDAGLEYDGKPGSLESAKLIAKLAALGYGSEVVAFNPEYRVVISKNRSVRQGGSGSARWKGIIEAAILSEANRVSAEFDRVGIDYDLYVERGPGGLKRAEFIVYAPKESILSIVREHEWGPVKVQIEPSWRKKIEFTRTELSRRPRPIMVGIDPGMSIGIAVMDLYGRILGLETLRRASRSEAIETLAQYGRPVLITTDVSPPPKNVVKIAQAFGARLVALNEHMKIEDKIKIVREFEERQGISVGSSHERDALAPLIKVYQRMRTLFEKAEGHLREMGGSLGLVDRTRLYELLTRGASIVEAIEGSRIRSEGKDGREEQIETLKAKQREIIELRRILRSKTEKIRSLEEELEYYRRKVRELEKEITKLMEELDKIRHQRKRELERDRLVSQLRERIRELEADVGRKDAMIDSLRAELRSLRRDVARSDLGPGWVPIKAVENLSRSTLEEAIVRGVLSEGDVVLVGDASTAGPRSVRLLKDAGVWAIVHSGSPPPPEVLSMLEEGGIFVTSTNSVEIRWKGAIPHVREEFLLRVAARRRPPKPVKEESEAGEGEDGGDILSIVWEYRRSLLDEEGATH